MPIRDYCPICGKGVKRYGDLVATPYVPIQAQHRCNPRVLRAIDAARARDDATGYVPSKADRFNEGCRLQELAGDD